MKMTKSINIKRNKLILESIIFTEVMNKFCKSLTEKSLLNTRNNLELCVSKLPELVNDYNNNDDRLSRLRNLVQIQGLLDECKDYLEFISRTRQTDIKPAVIELTKFVQKFEQANQSFIN
jgi:hypothetical protein